MSITFTDKVVVVTGAGHGLGKCYALDFAKRGAKVVVNDFGGSVSGTGASESAADLVVNEIKEQGGEAVANYDSVSTADGGKNIIQTALDNYGRIDVLVNNAGILRDKTFANMTLEDFQAVLDVHLMGTLYCTHAAWPHMKAQNYGRIVLVTSTSGIIGNFGQSNYGTAKGGIVGLMNVLRFEGEKYNIHVNCISPAAYTRMTENLMPVDAKDMIAPEKVVPAVVYLASEDVGNGILLHAAGDNYSLVELYSSEKVTIENATAEDIAENWEKISDMSKARKFDNPF